MKKKYNMLYILLMLLIILFIYILYVVIFDGNKIEKYDDYKINEISRYLKVNSMYYDGIQENLKTIDSSIKISEIDSIELNKRLASYVITNVVANNEYGYNECIDCFKYFSKDDNIKFYNTDDIDYIYNELVGGELKKITQDDLIDFNIIYYNKEIDKYYINIVYENMKPEILFEFKDHSYEDDMLYLDYYYSDIVYDEIDVEKIYLYDMNDIMVKELMYSDLYNEDNIVVNYDNYIEYFDIVRYVFKYDNDKYLLNEVKLFVE